LHILHSSVLLLLQTPRYRYKVPAPPMEPITSTQNPRIRQILRLDKSRERKEQNLFVIEGFKEINLALAHGYSLHALFHCPAVSGDRAAHKLLFQLPPEVEVWEVSRNVFARIAYRDQSDGVLALARPRHTELSSLRTSPNPFLIVLESVEKPGNLGAILRTADAASADAVLVCDPLTDIYNPNVVRSSIGCVFTRPVIPCTSQEACAWLRNKGVRILAAELTASTWYHQTDMTGPVAIVMGTEADGLTPFWLEQADGRIKIPMCGAIDSLNVSVSTAIITFEAMRQRSFNGRL